MTTFNFSNIDQAYDLINTSIIKTPLVSNDYVNQITGGNIFFKLENLQITGSFKFRGASHKIAKLTESTKKNGVIAYSFEDSVYVQFTNGETVRIARGGNALSTLSFMTDGRLMALSGNKFIAIDLSNGTREELLSWEFSDEPKAVEPPKDYIAEQQQSLVEYIKLQRKNRQEKDDAHKALAKEKHFEISSHGFPEFRHINFPGFRHMN